MRAITDDSGAVVESYDYDAWGRVLGVYDSEGRALTESALGNRYLWQGREYSWETGFYYFRARWYDPITGRWLSKDPIGISGGLNQYAFCGGNPVNARDPLGLCPESEKQEAIKLAGYMNVLQPNYNRLPGRPKYQCFEMACDLVDGLRGLGLNEYWRYQIIGGRRGRRWQPWPLHAQHHAVTVTPRENNLHGRTYVIDGYHVDWLGWNSERGITVTPLEDFERDWPHERGIID